MAKHFPKHPGSPARLSTRSAWSPQPPQHSRSGRAPSRTTAVAGLLRRGDLLFPAVLIDPRECGNGPGRDCALAGERYQRVICAHQPAGNLRRITTAGVEGTRSNQAHGNPFFDSPELRARHRKRVLCFKRRNNQVRQASLANASTGQTALFHLSAIWRTRAP